MPGTSEIRGQGALWGLVFEDGGGGESGRAPRCCKRDIFSWREAQGGAVVTFTPPFEIAEDEIGSCLETLLGI